MTKSISKNLSIQLFCDGASRGNPGPSAYGFVIQSHEGIIEQAGGYIGNTTNNVAEYRGLIEGLKVCKGLRADKLVVSSDSQLLVRQLLGEYKIKAVHLKPLFNEALVLLRAFPSFEIRHIPREENELADAMANEALDRHH